MKTNDIIALVLQFAVIIGIFWFFLIRPQRERQKKTETMRKNVKEGDEIITIGGIYGKVMNAKEDLITIEVGADKTKIKIARWAVGNVTNSEEKAIETDKLEGESK